MFTISFSLINFKLVFSYVWGITEIEKLSDDTLAIVREIPLIANVRPSGKDYLMEDFYYAGGILSLMHEL